MLKEHNTIVDQSFRSKMSEQSIVVPFAKLHQQHCESTHGHAKPKNSIPGAGMQRYVPSAAERTKELYMYVWWPPFVFTMYVSLFASSV